MYCLDRIAESDSPRCFYVMLIYRKNDFAESPKDLARYKNNFIGL